MSLLEILAIIAASCFLTWLIMGGWKRIPSPSIYLNPKLRPFIKQAREDQKITDYPGCARGIMFCRSTVCGCLNESEPSESFIVARCKIYAKRAEEEQK